MQYMLETIFFCVIIVLAPAVSSTTTCAAGTYLNQSSAIDNAGAVCASCPPNMTSNMASVGIEQCKCVDGYIPDTTSGPNKCVMIQCPAGQRYAYANVECTGCSCNEKQENASNYPNNNKRWPGSIPCAWIVSGNVAIILEQWGTHLQEYNKDWMFMCDRFSDPTLLCTLAQGVNSMWVPSRTGSYSMNWRKSSTCIDCPLATYRPQNDVNTNVMCTPCANNSGTNSTASTNVSDCKCNAGWSRLSQSNAVCSKCPSGKYKSERSHAACTVCPMGKFMSGNHLCIQCTVKYTWSFWDLCGWLDPRIESAIPQCNHHP